jgi:hypothetical protein
MTKSYMSTQARRNWASVIEQAYMDGEVVITVRNKINLVIKIAQSDRSPLDIPGVNTDITRQEMVDSVRESREMDDQDRQKSYFDKRKSRLNKDDKPANGILSTSEWR